MTRIIRDFKDMIDNCEKNFDFTFLSDLFSRFSSICFVFNSMTHETSSLTNVQFEKFFISWTFVVDDFKKNFFFYWFRRARVFAFF